jgi:hypothetical protein
VECSCYHHTRNEQETFVVHADVVTTPRGQLLLALRRCRRGLADRSGAEPLKRRATPTFFRDERRCLRLQLCPQGFGQPADDENLVNNDGTASLE